MKKTVFGVLGVVVLAAIVHLVYHLDKEEDDFYSSWKTFTPSSGLFSIAVPNSPQYGNDLAAIAKTDLKKRYDVYAAEQVDGTLFLVNVISYPKDFQFPPSRDILKQNVEELMHRHVHHNLGNFWDSRVENRNTLNFSFENDEYKMEGRSIHDGNRIYVLTYIAKKDGFDEENYRHFVDSFKILKSGDAKD